MNTLPYKIDAQDDGAGGWLSIQLDKSNLGFSPAETFSSVQISVTGLDGGSFDIMFKPRGGSEFLAFVIGATELDAVLLDQTFVFDAIRVDIFDAGASAAPKALVTFISRSF